MKKNILLVIIIIILVLIGGVIYLISSKNAENSEKSTKEAINELINERYNRQGNILTIEVLIDTGTFAKGSYNEASGGGGLWFAAKTSNGWELAYISNGIVTCEAANKYSFPRDIIPRCIDTQNNNNLIER